MQMNGCLKYEIIGALVNLIIIFVSVILSRTIIGMYTFVDIFFYVFSIGILAGIITGILSGFIVYCLLKKHKMKGWKIGGIIGILSVFIYNMAIVTVYYYSLLLYVALEFYVYMALIMTAIWIIPAFFIGAAINHFWKNQK